MTDEQFAIWNIGAVPHLLGQKAGVASDRLQRLGEMLGDIGSAGRKLVVRALAGQERPRASDAVSVEWSSVWVFTIPVSLIPVPHRPARRLHLERGIDHLNGAQDPRIVRSTKAKAYESKCVETDDERRGTRRLIRWAILDGDEAQTWRGGIGMIGLRDLAVRADSWEQAEKRFTLPSIASYNIAADCLRHSGVAIRVFEGPDVTFAELDQLSGRFAAGLSARGVRPIIRGRC